jgi:hypothetical protein
MMKMWKMKVKNSTFGFKNAHFIRVPEVIP